MRSRLVLLASLAGAPAAFAQGAPGTIEGTVTDSVRRHGLANATVIATPAGPVHDTVFHSATTDADGHFTIGQLAGGRYVLSVEHPYIDSTGVGVPPVPVDVSTRTVGIRLAIPSPATIRRILCPAAAKDTTLGLMIGVVRRPDGAPIAGADVVFAWSDFEVTKTGRAVPKELRASVRSDSSGVYRACGLPSGNRIAVQAQIGTDVHSGVLEEQIGESSVRVRDFVLNPPGVGGAVGAMAAATPTTTLVGHIGTQTGESVSGAHVRLYGTELATLSNEKGDFRLSGVPEGTQGIEVLSLGYEARRITVDVERNVAPLSVTLDRTAVVLDSVIVTAKRLARSYTKANRDFDARARVGSGHYFTESDIEARKPTFITDLLRLVPGVVVVRQGFDVGIFSTHGSMGFGNSSCAMALYVDGMQLDAQAVSDMSVQSVHGVEVVPALGGGTPPGYKSSPCGSIWIWSK